MKFPRVRFTVRRMMVGVALVGVVLSLCLSGYSFYLEREQIRLRIAARQRLLESIGSGNNAVLGRSAERGYNRISTKADFNVLKAERKQLRHPTEEEMEAERELIDAEIKALKLRIEP